MSKVFSAGALRVKSLLPDAVKAKFDPTKTLDKKGVQNLISDVITHGGDKAADTITDLSHLFFGKATEYGYSTPLSDYINDSEERDALLKEMQTAVDQVAGQNLTERERREKLLDISTKYQKVLTNQNLEHMLSKGSTAAKMAQTGARGNPNQLQQGTSSPIQSKMIDGTPIPIAIMHSFAEGLSPAEHLAMSYWGRGNTVQAQLATSKPGDMFKSITPNLYHEVVTEDDCGTRNGIMVDVDPQYKRRALYHFEAGTNRLIDEQYFDDLVASGKKQVKVRSTMTCVAKKGVCKKCYGLDSHGKLPEIGENVGVIAAQSASEVLTQMVLSTKHDSRSGKASNPFDETSNLLSNPAKFQDEATITDRDGTVTKIDVTPLGDHNVTIGSKTFFVPSAQDLTVKVGQSVRSGQALSTGTINPRQFVGIRGIGEGRRYMSDKLSDIYGKGLDPRHFDLIAKNLIKYVKVTDPGETGYLPGQVTTVEKITPALGDAEVLPLERAKGRKLAEKALELTPGTVLDAGHIQRLAAGGIDEVRVSKSGLTFEPIVPGLKTAKLNDDNWISRLAFRQIGQTLKEAAAFGLKSPVSDTDPITPYIIGEGFGKGQNGQY